MLLRRDTDQGHEQTFTDHGADDGQVGDTNINRTLPLNPVSVSSVLPFVFRQLLYDGTLFTFTPVQRRLALVQVPPERLSKLIELHHLTIEVGELACEQVMNLTTAFEPLSVLEPEKLFDFAQA